MKTKSQQHYEALSEEYDKKINVYCQNRFLPIIRKFSKGKILDLGCGTGYIQDRLGKKSIGVDISKSMLKKNKNKVFCANAESLPFKDNTFDFIYSVNLLEHVNNPGKVIKECRRVLKKNGTLLIITPNKGMEFALDIAERLKLKLPEGPHKFLNSKELETLFRENNFKIKSIDKLVIFPVEFGIISRIFEKTERIFEPMCLFICIIGSK